MGKAKDTKLVRKEVHSPSVHITVSDWGRVEARLHAWREKLGGGDEEIILDFKDIDIFELACIGKSAVSALRRMREVQDVQVQRRIEYATGWEEGDHGPN